MTRDFDTLRTGVVALRCNNRLPVEPMPPG
jgi:hypothetical protein